MLPQGSIHTVRFRTQGSAYKVALTRFLADGWAAFTECNSQAREPASAKVASIKLSPRQAVERGQPPTVAVAIWPKSKKRQHQLATVALAKAETTPDPAKESKDSKPSITKDQQPQQNHFSRKTCSHLRIRRSPMKAFGQMSGRVRQPQCWQMGAIVDANQLESVA